MLPAAVLSSPAQPTLGTPFYHKVPAPNANRKTPLLFRDQIYYDQLHTLNVAVDAGPQGRPEFRESQRAIARRYGLSEGDVTNLWNGTATRKEIELAFARLAKRSRREDRVIVDIVGHGHRARSGVVSLRTVDCRGVVTDADPGLMPMRRLLGLFRQIPARHKWLILDACQAGSMRGALDRALPRSGNNSLAKVRDREAIAVWLGSEEGQDTSYTVGGHTTLHQTLLDASETPELDEGLEALEKRVSDRGAPLIVGTLGNTHAQILLGSGEGAGQSVGSGARVPFVGFDGYEPESVKRAVGEMESSLLNAQLTVRQRALLSASCAWAHLCWPVPSAFPTHRERAVFLLTEACKVLSGEMRLRAMNMLASALTHNSGVQSGEDLKAGMRLYGELLAHPTIKANPDYVGEMENNRGVLCLEHAGDHPEFLPLAIDSFELAATHFTRERTPYDWALTRANLALAQMAWPEATGTRFALAETALRDAESVYVPPETYPQEWAMLQAHWGDWYRDVVKNPHADLDRAIERYGLALAYFNRKRSPYVWAHVQNNLGTAYLYRASPRAEDFDRGLACLRSALEVRTREGYPVEFAESSMHLGRILFRMQRYREAVAPFRAAREVYTELEWPKQVSECDAVLRFLPKDQGADKP